MLIPVDRLVDLYDIHPTGVLHLGAHLGEERDAYREAGFGEVWWVEANPDKITELTDYVYPDTVIHALVGEHEGQAATLRIASNGQSSSVLPFGTHAREHPEVKMTGETVELPIRTVDMLAHEHSIVADFINLDLQGYELAALKGATRFLTGVRWVYTEVNRKELYRGCPMIEEIDGYLDAHGFDRRVTDWTRHGWGDGCYIRRDPCAYT
jgi:FkbM family methyltransferase